MMLKKTLLYCLLVTICYANNAIATCPEGAEEACYFVKQVHQEVVPKLPVQMSQNLYLRQIMAMDNKMDWYVMLGYDKQYLLEEYAKVGAGLPEAKAVLEGVAWNTLCSNKMISPLFNKGLVVGFHYQFIDGENLVSFTINDCKK